MKGSVLLCLCLILIRISFWNGIVETNMPGSAVFIRPLFNEEYLLKL